MYVLNQICTNLGACIRVSSSKEVHTVIMEINQPFMNELAEISDLKKTMKAIEKW